VFAVAALVENVIVVCRYSVPVRSIAEDAAVLVSLRVVVVPLAVVVSVIFDEPWASTVPVAPVVTPARLMSKFHGIFDAAAVVAALVQVARVITVPEPHPLTVQSLTFNVTVGV
jgi:hypothetical protein